MTSKTAVDISTVASIDHREAHGLALDQYDRFAGLLAQVAPDDWRRGTDCEGWTIRDLAGHMVGAMRSAASLREMLRQRKMITARAKADGGNETDHMTAVQIELTAGLGPDELVMECRRLVEPAANGRKRIPAPMRKFVRFPVEIGSISETWSLGYLVDVILTRDTWMHRVDLALALGRPVEHGDTDRRIVADVVAEWARRHGQPFDLLLTGGSGSHYRSGSPEAKIEMDAVEFCRTLSGRAVGEGLLKQEVPF
ncbi:MAG: maleylpyruvate isomerase family mycothiol-dependent enzyme [Acidimicrobiia bacterium]|nr:maleylpyruvate isomerase family mycothiol-dependent enzyme [Acidimicrobiia bacterium]